MAGTNEARIRRSGEEEWSSPILGSLLDDFHVCLSPFQGPGLQRTRRHMGRPMAESEGASKRPPGLPFARLRQGTQDEKEKACPRSHNPPGGTFLPRPQVPKFDEGLGSVYLISSSALGARIGMRRRKKEREQR